MVRAFQLRRIIPKLTCTAVAHPSRQIRPLFKNTHACAVGQLLQRYIDVSQTQQPSPVSRCAPFPNSKVKVSILARNLKFLMKCAIVVLPKVLVPELSSKCRS